MSTLLVYAPALAHTKSHHPESHARLRGVLEALESHGVLADVTAVAPVSATAEQLQRVHTPHLIEQIRKIAERGGGLLDHGDTYATPQSYECATLAAGSCCAAVDRILGGHARNGLAIVRPPGHHAESNRVSGFCLLNNVAVAARQAQTVHGLKRVAIVDFDVHHGNGTQDIFYEDKSVLFVSLHLFAPMFYPGIGALHEVGQGEGEGFTVNVPLPPRVGDVGYGRLFAEVVGPKLAQFQPEMILVSAGFDAHWQDPLAMAGLSLTGYAHMAQQLVAWADEWCNGRLLFILEGGYKLDVLTYGLLNATYALLGRDQILDPLGAMPYPEHNVADLLTRLRQRHL